MYIQLDFQNGLIIAKYNSISLAFASFASSSRSFEGHTCTSSNNCEVFSQAFLSEYP